MSCSFPSAATALVAAAVVGADPSTAFPGPAAWDGKAWAGVLLYLLLFAAALEGIRRLSADGDPR